MKKIILLLLFTSVFACGFAQTPFISVWKSDNFSGPNSGAVAPTKIKFPFNGTSYAGTYVKVGEPLVNGSFDNATLTNNVLDVPSAGSYEITITNVSSDFYMQFGQTPANTHCQKLTEIKQWGNLWTFKNGSIFYGCINLEVTATDAPLLAGDIAAMFQACNTLTGINSAFNSWNTSAVTNMGNFFRATAFNAPINNWDVSNVTNMANMFYNNASFNQPLNSWTVTKVASTATMFFGATAFNQNLGSWNLKAATSMLNMFQGATGLNCVNFSLTLKGWANNTEMPNSINLGTIPNIVKFGDQVAYDKLTNTIANNGKGWTITGPTYDATCAQILPVTFTSLSASLKNSMLTVNWQTASEKNNDYFIIYASENGKEWIEQAKISTKAIGGNSNELLSYQYKGTYKSNIQYAGFSMLGIMLILLLCFANKRKMAHIAALMFVAVMFANCSREEITIEKDKVRYVKISQIDKDGETSSESDATVVK